MRTEDEVLERLAALHAKRLKERKEKFLCRCPRNCSFNRLLRVKGTGRVGFCHNPVLINKLKKPLFVCNEQETSEKCPFFDCKNTEESVEADFRKVIKSPSRCGDEYPKMAMLIWVIQKYEPPKRCSRFKRSVRNGWRAVWHFLLLRWW